MVDNQPFMLKHPRPGYISGTGAGMTIASQKKAVSAHRRRASARGLVRLEVQASKGDAGLIRALAEALRREPANAGALRSALEKTLGDSDTRTAFDVFGSDLPDEVFADVLEQPRARKWRDIAL